MSLYSVALSSAGMATGIFASASTAVATGLVTALAAENAGIESFYVATTAATIGASLVVGAAGMLTISPFTAGFQIAARITALVLGTTTGTFAGLLQTEDPPEREISDKTLVFGGAAGLITGIFSAVIATTHFAPPVAEASIGAVVSGLTSYATAVLIG